MGTLFSGSPPAGPCTAADRARTFSCPVCGGHAAWALRSAPLRPAGAGRPHLTGTDLPEANRRHSGAPGPVSREQGGRAVRRRADWRRWVRFGGCCRARWGRPPLVASCCHLLPQKAGLRVATSGNKWTQVATKRAQAALGKTPDVLCPARCPMPGGRVRDRGPLPLSAPCSGSPVQHPRRGRGAETSFRGGP